MPLREGVITYQKPLFEFIKITKSGCYWYSYSNIDYLHCIIGLLPMRIITLLLMR